MRPPEPPNVAVGGRNYVQAHAEQIFDGEPYVVIEASTLPELLVKLGVYATRSEARRAGRDGPIPLGFNEIRASKKVPRLYVWNPATDGTLTDEELAWCAEMDRLYPCP